MGAMPSYLISGLTAASCCALVALGLSGLLPTPTLFGPWPWIAVGTGVGVAVFALATCHYKKLYDPLRRYLDTLVRIDARAPLVPNDFPRLPDGHPLEKHGQHLWNSFATLSERVQELEQSRAAIEVRCRRAAARGRTDPHHPHGVERPHSGDRRLRRTGAGQPQRRGAVSLRPETPSRSAPCSKSSTARSSSIC